MKSFLVFLLLCILSLSPVTLKSQLRDPFEFKKTEKAPQQDTQQSTNLSKWNIKEQGDDLIIIENSDNGQIRTIEINSFS